MTAKFYKKYRRYFFICLLIYTAGVAGYVTWSVWETEKTLIGNIDEKLETAARALQYMLPPDFHDRATDKESVSFEEEMKNRRAFNGFAKDTNMIYLYTLVEKDGKFCFSAPTVTDEEARERKSWYFYPYEDVPQEFIAAFREKRTAFVSYSDQWGQFRSVAIPQTSPGGRTYLACADNEISHIRAILYRAYLKNILTAIGFMLLQTPFILLYRGYSTELRTVNTALSVQTNQLEELVNIRTLILKNTQKALETSEQRLRLAIEASGLGLYDLDIVTGRIFFNDVWYKNLGYQPEDIEPVLEAWTELIHPEDRAEAAQEFRDYLAGLIPVYIPEFRVRDKNGRWRWLYGRGEVVQKDTDAAPLRMVGTFMDITERKHIEQELHKKSERLREAHRIALVGEWEYDHRSQQFETSGMMRRIFGLPDDAVDISWRTFLEKIHPDDRADVNISENIENYHEILCRFLDTRDETVTRITGDGGEIRYIQSGHQTLYDALRQPLRTVGTVQDVTRSRRIAEELEQAKREAERASMAKSIFLANMSHELRTPLNAIIGFSHVLLRGRDIPDESRRHIEVINRSGEHLLELITQVLDMSKIEAGKMRLCEKEVSLSGLLADVVSMFRMKAEKKNLALVFECDPELPVCVHADATRLSQVLINLMGNAVKFTRTGHVALRVTLPDDPKPVASPEDIACVLTPIRFEVEDTGPGIEPAEQAHLFDAFSQTAAGLADQGGTGLGLTISRGYVRMMGGDIEVDSEPGQGSTFGFTILLKVFKSRECRFSEQGRKIIGLAPDQPRFRLLVADDKWENRQILSSLLIPTGFDVREAESGEAAVEIWKSWRPHLIWMDLRMPGMGGAEAVRQIRTLPGGEDTVIIAQTAAATKADQDEACDAGCKDVLVKPFREADVFNLLHNHLDVRYVYETPATGDDAPLTIPAPEILDCIPRDLLTALRQAATTADIAKIKNISKQIRSHSNEVADIVAHWVDQFEYEKILAFIRHIDEQQIAGTGMGP